MLTIASYTFMRIGRVFAAPFAHLFDFIYDVFDSVKIIR